MKTNEVLHFLSIAVGLVAVVQLMSAWSVGDGGSLGAFSQGELYVNSLILAVLALWLGMGAFWHRG